MNLLECLRSLFVKPKYKSPLRQELEGLYRNIDFFDEKLNRAVAQWRLNGSVCCPECGVLGYTALVRAQERRRKRVAELLMKLNKK